jgi:DNA-binding XRE family transcriptional regulator
MVTRARQALGARLAEFRDRAGYTQASLAARLGYSRSAVANAEVGEGRGPQFWAKADQVLDTGGVLAAEFYRIERLRRGQRAGPISSDDQADIAGPGGASEVWPLLVGVIPPVADCYQERAAPGFDLHSTLRAGQTAVLIQVLQGLGGTGKTQIAAHYAKAVWQAGSVDLLVWLTASSKQAIIAGYAGALCRIESREPDDNAEAAAVWFLNWLAATERRWLVVLDDLADPRDLKGRWPQGRSGRTVLTTQRRDRSLRGQDRLVVEVGLFTPEEAVAYLISKLGGDEHRLEQAAELAEDLGFLPLALSQAAAYIDDHQLTCAEYRTRFASQQRTCAQLFPPDALPDDYPHTVAATVSLAIKRADKLDPAGLARPALQLAAMLDPNGIPEAVFATNASRAYLAAHRTPNPFPPDPRSAEDGRSPAHDTLEVSGEDAIDAFSSCLGRLSLVTMDRNSPFRTVRVHALVQRVVREQLTPDLYHVTARTAADALLEAWPELDTKPMLSQALRDGTDNLRQHSAQALWSPEMHPVLFRCGDSIGDVGLVSQAAAYWEDLVAACLENLEPDDPRTLRARLNLASSRGRAGDAQAAVRDLEELRADCQRWLGSDHPLTREIRVNLARWRGEAMDADGAVRDLEELLAEQLQILGPEQRETLQTRHHLAYWYGYGGNAARSIQLFEDLIADWQRVLGPDDPELLSIRANLAFRRGISGDPAGAARAFTELVPDRIRINGPDHPATLNNRGNLARWRGEAGDPSWAVVALEELLADSERVLGPNHQHVLNTRSDLAHYRGMAGDPAGAAQALEALVPDYLRVLGPDHWETLTNRDRLAHWLDAAGNPAEAARVRQGLLADRLRVLGPDHPDTVATQAALNADQTSPAERRDDG